MSEKNSKNKLFFKVDNKSFIDNGDGSVQFKNGLVITDDSEQRNGTKYDIRSMDLSEYHGKLTANHSMDIQEIIGKVMNVRKVASRRVVVDGIQFAVKESPLAQFAYNMLVGGYLTDFSIETVGPWPDEEGIYKDSKLIGLSAVVTGNNKSAAINEIALNSIEQSKELGLDTSIVEDNFVCYDNDAENNKNNKEQDMKFVTVKNSRDFEVTLKYKNAAGDECTKVLVAGETLDVSEDQEKALNALIANAVKPKAEEEESDDSKKENMAEIVKNAVAPLLEKVKELEQTVFDNSAKEPSFKKAKVDGFSISKNASTDLEAIGWKERSAMQINAAWEMLKDHSTEAANKLKTINGFHLEKLQEAGKVDNAVTISDFGNFVISPELLTTIEGFRSDFQPLISRLDFRETLSLQMAWLKRSGDISMSEVEMCDDGANGNLKPISDYGAEINQSNLHELAAVTPVCNAATRFLAADLLGDVAAGYRNDYDRKRAQIAIARFQQAVDSTGNKVPFNVSATIGATALNSIISVASQVAEEIASGVWIFNYKTYYELLRRAMTAGINTDSGFGMFSTGAVKQLVGHDYIVVPNELMPSLNTNETKTFIVEGVSVTINQAMFFVDLSTFSGRTSGGLMYDLSTEAAYEENSTVKSAFQRNELVLRGSFFRGAAVRDEDKVASMYAAGVS